MGIFRAKPLTALPTLLAALVLSGCGHTSGLEVSKGVGMGVLAVMAAGTATDCRDHSQPNNRSICEDRTEAVVKLGRSLYSELKPADGSPGADELSNDLDTFIEQRRTPAIDDKDDTEETSSP